MGSLKRGRGSLMLVDWNIDGTGGDTIQSRRYVCYVVGTIYMQGAGRGVEVADHNNMKMRSIC